jgi:hypothetical protein
MVLRRPSACICYPQEPLVRLKESATVGVAQLVERWIVVPVAEGSNPSTHPNPFNSLRRVHFRSPFGVPKSVPKAGFVCSGIIPKPNEAAWFRRVVAASARNSAIRFSFSLQTARLSIGGLAPLGIISSGFGRPDVASMQFLGCPRGLFCRCWPEIQSPRTNRVRRGGCFRRLQVVRL